MKAKLIPTPEVLTLRQAALYLRCSPATLYRLANRGAVPAFRLGGSWRFQSAELDRWIARRTTR